MEDNKMSLLFNAKLNYFEKINDQFLKAKCYVMALGKNVNKSHFSKDNVDRAYPTLSFVPVIGHLMCDENGTHYLGGHDVSLDLTTLTLKSKCVPFGVAVPSNTPTYEDVEEADGTKSTYLVTDVILWIGRYPELAEAIYDEETYFGQSMEILFSKAEALKEDPTYMDIIDFSFDALCLLGKSDDERFNQTPCFPNASVKPITYSLNQDEFTSLMNEMKEQLSFCMNNTDNDQGGNILNEKNTILQKYNKTVEDLDFSIDDLSVDELETKMEELFGEKKEPIAFSATYNQKRDALRNALDPIIVKDSDGNWIEETYFYVSDFDDSNVYVEVDHWTANGDFDSKYGKYAYAFDESTLTATISDDFVEMVKVWLTLEEKAKLDEERASYEALKQEFEKYKQDYTVSKDDYEELKQYQIVKEAEERKNEEDAIFKKFEPKIGDTNEFVELKKNKSDYSVEDLRKECLCIVGLYSLDEENDKPAEPSPNKPIKFSTNSNLPSQEEDPIEATYKKYLNK